MKKTLCLLLALACLALPACAEGAMRVVNCEEWVSLRSQPSRSAERIAQIPLGETVTGCVPRDDEFTYCEYKGLSGYVLSSYLAPVTDRVTEDGIGFTLFSLNDILALNEPFLDGEAGGYRVVASRCGVSNEDGTGGEYLRVGCFLDGAPVWGYATHKDGVGQYDGLHAFLSGTQDEPYVGIHNVSIGLLAVSPRDGESLFSLPASEVPLGCIACCATGADGTLYTAGADGPGPLAISAEGKLLWTGDLDDPDIYWPYDMQVRGDGLLVHYDSPAENGHPVVLFGFDGSVQWVSSEE